MPLWIAYDSYRKKFSREFIEQTGALVQEGGELVEPSKALCECPGLSQIQRNRQGQHSP